MELRGKNILVIMPYYFEYEKKIKKALAKTGADVFMINDDLFMENPFYHFLKAYSTDLYVKVANRNAQKRIEQSKKIFDVVLVIRGDSYSKEFDVFLKSKFPKAKKVMYQWDSVERHPKAVQIADFFDAIYTFDREDAKRYGWSYRPLFFDKDDCISISDKAIDLMFVGSLHSNRAKELAALERIARANDLYLYSFMYCKLMTYIRQKYIKRNASFQIASSKISFSSMPINETNRLYDATRCVVDFVALGQRGLTMRTIESLGHKCKLVTNNECVIQEPFYNENNVLLIRKMEELDKIVDFINIEYEDVDDSIYDKYTVEQFVEDLFGGI